MFKVNFEDTRTTPGVVIVNFEHISQLVLVFLLLTCELVNTEWDPCFFFAKCNQ